MYLGAVGARCDHVGLQESPLQQHMMIIQRLIHGRQHRLRGRRTPVNIMGPICQDLGLHNRHEPVLLTDDGIPRQPLSILLNAQLRRLSGPNLEHGPPLGEACPRLVVLLAAAAQGVEPLRGGLAVGAGDVDGALVDLDPRDDVVLLEDVDEGLAVGGFLVEGLLEEDDAGEVGEGGGGGEEELAEGLPVRLDVLDVDAGETLSDGAGALVGGEDALARGGDVLGVLD